MGQTISNLNDTMADVTCRCYPLKRKLSLKSMIKIERKMNTFEYFRPS